MDIEETLMLSAGGDELASKQLSESLYKELRNLAGLKMRSEERGHTLQPTALVNEALVRLLKSKKPTHERGHFLALAAMAMQRVLIDYGRKRRAKRRGGDWNRKSIEGMEPSSPAPPDQFSSLAEALLKLEEIDPQKAEIVRLRIFGGMTIAEVAETSGVSKTTVDKEWSAAKAWLGRELTR